MPAEPAFSMGEARAELFRCLHNIQADFETAIRDERPTTLIAEARSRLSFALAILCHEGGVEEAIRMDRQAAESWALDHVQAEIDAYGAQEPDSGWAGWQIVRDAA